MQCQPDLCWSRSNLAQRHAPDACSQQIDGLKVVGESGGVGLLVHAEHEELDLGDVHIKGQVAGDAQGQQQQPRRQAPAPPPAQRTSDLTMCCAVIASSLISDA